MLQAYEVAIFVKQEQGANTPITASFASYLLTTSIILR
jgi:hypothetical protein